MLPNSAGVTPGVASRPRGGLTSTRPSSIDRQRHRFENADAPAGSLAMAEPDTFEGLSLGRVPNRPGARWHVLASRVLAYTAAP
jgi:hypothetical protein